ncbi:MAG: biotin transporter BioY [Chloroflexi bacterium]|nr:biotin transporter BioY [Chloroflexota bacterium]
MQAQAVARPAVLVDAILPRSWGQSRARRLAVDLGLMIGFAWFVAFCAQIAFKTPWTTVPITFQTFAVLVTGGSLGAWRGAGSLLIYMLMGMISIPVYAPSLSLTGNWDGHFIFPWKGTESLPWDLSSGGYIVGFILAAFVAGYFAQKAWDRKPWGLLSMLTANALLYIPGLLWLGYLIATDWLHPLAHKPLGDLIAGSGTIDKTFKGGLYPFIVGDLMKLYLATLVLPGAWALANWARGRKGTPQAKS